MFQFRKEFIPKEEVVEYKSLTNIYNYFILEIIMLECLACSNSNIILGSKML